MGILYTSRKTPLKWPTSSPFNISDKKILTIDYRPKTYSTSEAYVPGIDVVQSTVYNGCYFTPSNPGISGVTEPTWSTDPLIPTTDGTIVWVASPDILPIRQGDIITTSTWSCIAQGSNYNPTTLTSPIVGFTFTSPSIISSTTTQTTLATSLLSLLSPITIINHITITRVGGFTEEMDVPIYLTTTNL